MTSEEVYAQLNQVFQEVFFDESLTVSAATTAADVPGWDSFKMVSLILEIESKFGIRLRSRDVDGLKCVGDFVNLILQKVNSK